MIRDLPMPGSPAISTSWPSPARARSQRREEAQFLIAADERRERPHAAPSAAAAGANDAIKGQGLGDALQLMLALLLDDEESRNLALNRRSDQDGSRFGGCLHPRSHVRRFAEHLPGRVDHDQA